MSNLTVLLPGREPYWIDLRIGEARCRWRVKPLSTAIMEGARWASRRAMAAAVKAGYDPAGPEVIGDGQQAFFVAVARTAVVDWEGMIDEAHAPLACTPELVAAVLDIPEIALAFDAAYIKPYAERLAEKNASAPAANGTSAAGPDTAEAAAPTRADGAPPAPI